MHDEVTRRDGLQLVGALAVAIPVLTFQEGCRRG